MSSSSLSNLEHKDFNFGCLFDSATGESRQIKIFNKVGADDVVTSTYTEVDGSAITLSATEIVTDGPCVEMDLVIGSAVPICVENPVGVFTQAYVREVNVVDNSDASQGPSTEYTLDGAVWSTTVPTGTITTGACPIPASPEIDVTYNTWLPVCVDNAQWYFSEKVSVDNADGTETITKVYKLGAEGAISETAPVGVATEGYCTDADLAYDTEVGCLFDSGTQESRPVKIVDTIDDNGDVTTEYTEVDGTPIVLAATETVTQGPCRPLVIATHDEPGCAADGETYTRRTLSYYNGSGTIVTTTVSWFDSANVETAVMPVGFRLGACLDVVRSIEGWAVEVTGVAAAVLPVSSPVRSLTVSVSIGDVTVNTGNGSLTIFGGSSYTWNQGNNEDMDVTNFVFTGSAATTRYTIHGEVVA